MAKNGRKNGNLDTLTPNEWRFVAGYLAGKPACRAYMAAGFRGNYGVARVESGKLLAKHSIQAAIEVARREALDRAQVTTDKVVAGLAAVAFADVAELFHDDDTMRRIVDLDPETRAAVAGVEIKETVVQDGEDDNPILVTHKKVRLADRVKALVTLGEYLGILGPKSEPKRADDADRAVHVREIIITTREQYEDYCAGRRAGALPAADAVLE